MVWPYISIVKHNQNDTFISAGGQTTMLYDINRRYPRAYIHHHKLTADYCLKGFNSEEPAEIVGMVSQIDRLLECDHDYIIKT